MNNTGIAPPYRQDYSGVKALIMGLGLNGGGLESARYLGLRGAELCITDLRDEKTLAPSIEKLEAGLSGTGSRIRYVLGRHESSDFEKADLVIKNPGVRPDSPYLRSCRRIETDISLFLAAAGNGGLHSARLIAVTGSKGKSSTASALHWVLKNWHNSAGGAAYLGGNITVSPLSFLDELEQRSPAGVPDDMVLELSSWQLGDLRGRINEKTGEALLKPRTAVITAIMPDHLDFYGNMEAYVADKRVIYQGQDEKDATVAGDDSWGQSFIKETRGRPLVYPLTLDKTGETFEAMPRELRVPGRHQRQNLFAAALALLDLGLPADFIRESLGNYPGIEHRLEFFHEAKGVCFYNDSAATIPEAAAAAIGAFEPGPVLICGGTDKNLDFSPLAEAASGAKALILLEGSGTDKLIPLLKAANLAYKGPFASLDAALEAALESAAADGVIVLSPGCASFGMFINEFDRGRKWKEAVRRSA